MGQSVRGASEGLLVWQKKAKSNVRKKIKRSKFYRNIDKKYSAIRKIDSKTENDTIIYG